MRASWHDSEPMLLWLDIIENEHRFPTQKEVAQKAGMAPPAFQVNHWKKRWRKFFNDIRYKTSLIRRLQEAAVERGLFWDPKELATAEIETILAPRAKRPHA
jgi:fructosamine-3-kinase